jgi:hypothetical protein
MLKSIEIAFFSEDFIPQKRQYAAASERGASRTDGLEEEAAPSGKPAVGTGAKDRGQFTFRRRRRPIVCGG